MTNPQETQTQASTPDHAKYEALTGKITKDLQTRTNGLEDAIVKAWATHTDANKTDQGKGLGDALYTAARKYVLEEVYGIKGPLPGNDDLQTQVEAMISSTIGFKKADLADVYNDKKEVHFGHIGQIREKAKESISNAVQGIHQQKLNDLGEDDKDSFRGYVKNLASTIGVILKDEKLLTMHQLKQTYMTILPMYVEAQQQKEKAEAVSKGLAK